MTNNLHRVEEDEIDIKEIFSTIYRYKVMIILFVLSAGIVSSYIAYFKILTTIFVSIVVLLKKRIL